MESKYLIDTNVVIDFLANKLPETGFLEIEESIPNVSVITRMELLSWSKADDVQLKILQKFLDASIIYNLEESIILKAIEIRKHHKTKLPDAIIAATALVYDLKLLSRNVDDFKKIANLKFISSHDI